ncbi:MAG: OmpA family protein [Bacteroidales bacterium]|nr:OmpA family protein [Bacteroidales bacterium]MBN2697231.1 OmpA family protein [Bacteroidales bacterium]
MKYSLFASLILLFSFLIPAGAQEQVKIIKKEFRYDNTEGFKEAWKSIREGDLYFAAGKGTYDLARDHYLFAHQYNPDNPALNYKIGVCHLYSGSPYEAIKYLLRAYELNPKVTGDIHHMMGRSYHQVLEFDRAIEEYKLHKEALPPEKLSEYEPQFTKLINECQHGKEITREPVRVIIQNLGENINSKYDDYNPVFAHNDTVLFFTSRRPFETSKRNPIDNKFNEDIYVSFNRNGDLRESARLDKPFNSPHNESVVGVSPNGDRILLYKGHIDGGDLFLATYNAKKEKWNKPKPVSKSLRSKQGETSACFSPDGKELYFISRNEKLTRGGKDILVSRLDSKEKWSDPVNAGSILNTLYDEEGVYITPDGSTLYFSSRGHNSMGGFDIFRSVRNELGGWSIPENLGYPINTPADELFFVTDAEGVYGYYSTVPEGGMGGKDICRVMFLGSEKELVMLTRDHLVAGKDYLSGGFLTMPEKILVDTTITVEGRVIDPKSDSIPVVARLTFIDPDDGSTDANAISDASGRYTARLPEAKTYGVEINATGYLYFLDIVDLSGKSSDEKVYRDFYLQKIEVGTKVVLENIYFETGKAILRAESYESLDQVYKFMENNPTVQLEISGHTDNTGTYKINSKLSRDRAKAVVDYLTGRGIPADRLVYEGYADSQPIATNDTAAGRERNRRVEFKVISK